MAGDMGEPPGSVHVGGGDGGGWRRHPCRFSYHAAYGLDRQPPVLVDGKLYVVVERPWYYEMPDRIMVIEVASGAHPLRWVQPIIGETVLYVHTIEYVLPRGLTRQHTIR